MMRLELGRLRWRLLAANLAVAAAGVTAAAVGVWLAAPGAFADAMGRAGMMGGGQGGMMGGTGSIGATASIGAVDPLLRGAFGDAVGTAIWLGLAGAAVVAVAASVVLAAHLSRPIDELAAASRRVAAGDYSRPVPPAAGELGELAASFNAMAAGLAAEEQRRRDLIGDVAHELRTPIASVRGYVEGLSAGVFEAGPDAWRVLDEQTARLERLVGDLATLWQAESSDRQLSITVVDASAALADAQERHRATAAARSITVELDAAAVRVLADPMRLAQVIDNLVGNALRYGRDGGTVMLRLRAEGRQGVLSVRDDGPGLDPAEAARVFDRFYRADGSRSRAAGGSGLGLAIAKTLVEAMGGAISVASQGHGLGSTFTVRLPLA
jgi:two-component system sensor histidine kinase BaeS